jgi:glucosamine--fructose-6-phosphate aminotransferase (isomerizing)
MAAEATPRSALYETILSQPEVVRTVLADAAAQASEAAGILAGARRIFLAGTGTSSHAAVVGEHLFRAAGADAYATTNFDFAVYPRPLGADDALVEISHRGSKRYGTRAIERARSVGARVIGITGQSSPMAGPEVVIATAPQERSATHTASYTANLAVLALITVRIGEQTGRDVGDLRAAVERLAENIAGMLASEGQIRPLAEALAGRGRLVLAGAGPNAVTAREGALKVKESSYLTAEGFELETLLHGGLQAVQAGDVAVVIAAQGPALERIVDAVRALTTIGARVLVVADERAIPTLVAVEGPTTITFPATPEPLSPALAVIPLQLLASLTADLRGANPDSFRAHEPVYKRANESYAL